MNGLRATRVLSLATRVALVLAPGLVCGAALPGVPQAAKPSKPPKSAAAPDPRARTPEEISAAREYFLMARESERLGDTEAALSWYALAFRHDARSRDLCFLYLERLKDAGAVDSAVATARACEALAGDTARTAPSSARAPLTLAERKLLGDVALRADDGAAALRHYREAARLDEDDGDVLYVLAGLYEEAEEWEGHADAVRRLLPRLDYPPRLLERLARTYARLGRPEAIVPVLAEAWDKTRSPVFGMTLAAHYESTGRNLSLLRTARALAETRPSPETEALLARAFVLADRPDSALTVVGRLLAAAGASPDDAGLRTMQASLLFERGRYREAEARAATLAKELPDEAIPHLLEGSARLERRGRAEAVRASLDRALRLAPLSPDVRARRAYAEYALGGRGARARAAFVDSLLVMPAGGPAPGAGGEDVSPERDDPPHEAPGASRDGSAVDSPVPAGPEGPEAERRTLLEALAHGRLGQELAPRDPGQRPAVFTDTALSRRHRLLALSRYDAILARNPAQRAALFEAGALCERLGDLDRAKALLRRLVARDSLHATGMNYLAYTLIERDSVTPEEMAEADGLLTRALALDPENGAFLDSRGWWHFRKGQPDSAVAWLEAALEAVPADPAVLDHLARAQEAAGRLDAACATRERLRAAAPGLPGVRANVCPAPAAAGRKNAP